MPFYNEMERYCVYFLKSRKSRGGSFLNFLFRNAVVMFAFQYKRADEWPSASARRCIERNVIARKK